MIVQKSFVIHEEWVRAMESFPDDLQFELYKAIMAYGFTGEVPELSASASIAFSFIKVKMDENKQLYKEKCEQLKGNARKGGAPKGNKNATKTTISEEKQPKTTKTTISEEKQPKTTKTTISEKNNLDNDYDNELLSNSNELSNNKKKNKNNNIFIEKREGDTDFDTHFRTLAIPIWNGKECEIWRELMTKKHGIQNWGKAVIDFKNHIIEQGNEAKVMDFTDHEELKKYMTNALNVKNRDGNNFLSDDAKKVPNRTYYEFAQIQDPTKWREPCKRLPNIEVEAYGKKIIVGVVLQDGKELYCSPDLPKPPSRFHYYNPFKEIYDDVTLKDHLRQQDVDLIPAGILALKKDFYLEQHKENYINRPLDF